METEKHLSLIGHPVCVMGCGIVTSSNDTDQSFAIRGSQYVAGRTQEFMVYCRTDINPKWSQDNGQRRFPKAHASIGFAGTVVHFRRYTLANMERTIHTVVVDLQHIACVKERVGMLRPPPPQNPDLQAKLKETMRKRKQQRTSGSSSDTLGKRPAPTNSDEEVNGSVV